jgi:hypothetical protein
MGTPRQQQEANGAGIVPEVMDEGADQLVPFPVTGGGSSGLDAITRGEIDVQVSTAHKFPRALKRALQDAQTMALLDEDTAQRCFYVLERGGKKIEGPGVRLAEIFANAWGNLRFGSRIIDEGEKFITAQGFCHDLQTNVAACVEVVRRITDKKGRRYNDDMIATTANAAQSIALRNAIFRVVPRVYVDQIFQKAKAVAIGTVATLSERRQKAMEWYAKAGVKPERILAKLGKAGIEEIGLPELETLIGISTAIRDGQTTIDESFPAVAMAEKPSDAAPASKAAAAAAHVENLANQAKKPEDKKEPAQAAAPSPSQK